MRRGEILLSVAFVSLFSIAPLGAADEATPGHGAERGVPLPTEQIDALKAELQILEEISGLTAESSHLQSIADQLQRIENWNQALASDHPVRTAAQLRLHLGLLTVELDRQRAEISRQTGLVLERRPLVAKHPAPDQETPLLSTGTFSGTITEADTTNGIEGVLVNIADSNGDWVASVLTDGSGSYASPDLSSGDYVANTLDLTGYINELYNDRPCFFYCHLPNGDPITVTVGSDNSGIDFQLVLGGTISGTVTDADTKVGLEPILVDFFDSNGDWVGNIGTDGSGNYASAGLLAGDYYSATYNWTQYVDELYNEKFCPYGCDPTTGDTIVVETGEVTTDVDFTLEKGGSIAGNVKVDPSGPVLVGVAIDVFDSSENYATTGWTNASGDYIADRGLPEGDYYAKTVNNLGYIDELYHDIICPSWCDLSSGLAIEVDMGVTTSGIDFALSSGGLISGTVTEEGTGTPLADIEVNIMDVAGKHVTYGRTDGSGNYTIYNSLPPGTYHAKTWNHQGYVNELYDGISCPNWCDLMLGDDILLAAGATTTGVDFALSLGGRISGTVTAAGTGAPLEGVFVDLFTPTEEFISNPTSDSSGEYLSPALPPGTYFARTWNDQGYINELYDDIPCLGCLLTAGTPIVVTTGAVTEDIDIELQLAGRVSGTVTEDGSGLPLQDIRVEIFGSTGQFVAWAPTDADGGYAINDGLPAGDYYLKTWNDQDYINELFDETPCASCTPTDGMPLVIGVGEVVSGIDFALSKGGLISGVVTDVTTHTGIQSIGVHVHDLAGSWIQSTSTEAGGNYLMKVGLPTDSYYVRTSNGQGYVNEVHDDIECIGACEFDSATPIAVTAGSTKTGIDFALGLGAKISGTVTDAGSGLPIDDSEVVLISTSGELGAAARVRSDGTYSTWGAVPAGLYYVATRNFAGYLDELYPDKPCLGGAEFCDLSAGATVQLPAGSTTPNIDFALSLGGWFEGAVLDEIWARGLAGIGIHIFDSGGDQVSTVTWQRPLEDDGKYRTCGLPTGTYYARTDSSLLAWKYIDELFDDISCLDGCDVTLGAPISVVAGAGTPDIDFELGLKLFADGFESGDFRAWSKSVP